MSLAITPKEVALHSLDRVQVIHMFLSVMAAFGGPNLFVLMDGPKKGMVVSSALVSC